MLAAEMRGNNNSKRFGMKFQVRWHESNWSMPISNLLEHNYSNCFFHKYKLLFQIGSDHIVQSGIGKCNLSSCTHKKIPSLKVMLPRFETIGPLGPLRFLLHSKKKRKRKKGFQQEKVTPDGKNLTLKLIKQVRIRWINSLTTKKYQEKDSKKYYLIRPIVLFFLKAWGELFKL